MWSTMNCKICRAKSVFLFNATILNRYTIKYFSCVSCKFTYTEEPYWLNEAYSSVINSSDTGIMHRNLLFADTASIIFRLLKLNCNRPFLDFGGGYGIFTRLMRDRGFDFFWFDKFATNLVARGFEKNLNEGPFEGITSFENFEHFLDPCSEIRRLLESSGFVIFSTELVPEDKTNLESWWYLGLEHGQHISFFSKESLLEIAKNNGVNFYTKGKDLHILSRESISGNVFFVAKLIRKFRLEKFFYMKSKTSLDMQEMIRRSSS